MKPHPRIRTTIKWGGAAVTVLLVVVWGWSSTHILSREVATGNQWELIAGAICYTEVSLPPFRGFSHTPLGWEMRPIPFHLIWVPYADENLPSYRSRLISLWPFILMAAGVTVWAWRLDTLARRGERVGRCPKCNYDRAGLAVGAVCPECGSKGGPA